MVSIAMNPPYDVNITDVHTAHTLCKSVMIFGIHLSLNLVRSHHFLLLLVLWYLVGPLDLLES